MTSEVAPRNRPWAWGVAVGLLVVITGLPVCLPDYLARHTYLPGFDGDAYLTTTFRIIATGSVIVDEPDTRLSDEQLASPYGSLYSIDRQQRLRPKNPTILSWLLVPGVILAGKSGAVFTGLLLHGLLAGWITRWVTPTTGGPAAAITTLGLLVGMPAARTVGFGVSIDTLIALAMVASLALADDDRPISCAVIGVLSVLLRPTMPLLIAPALFLLWRRGGRRSLVRFTLAATPIAVAIGIGKWWLWGVPWGNSYDRTAIWIDGVLEVANHSGTFDAPILDGLRLLVLDGSHGLVGQLPVIAIALAAFALPEARRDRWAAPFVAATVAYLMLAPYRFIHDLPGHAHRFAFPLLVTAIPPIALLLARLLRARKAQNKPASGPPADAS